MDNRTRLINEHWKKSYLLEFRKADGTLEDVFTFSLPPQSEELTYSQRKTETKTFGGLHVDDYGIDAVKISLSGSTINNSLKKIYRPGKSDKWLSGEEEILHLRDLLVKYKTGKKNIEKVMMLYDLSKIGDVRGTRTLKRATRNYWRVFVGDFKIKRASDKPFTYNYSIEFTGVEPEKEIKSKYPSWFTMDFEKTIKWLEDTLFQINSMFDWADNIQNYVVEARSFVNGFYDILAVVTDGISGFVENAAVSVDGIISESTGILDDTRGAIRYSMEQGLKIENAALSVVKSVEKLMKEIRSLWEEDAWIPQDVLEQYGVTAQGFKDSAEEIMTLAENISCKLGAGIKAGVPETTIGDGEAAEGQSEAAGASGEEGSSKIQKDIIVNENGRVYSALIVVSYGKTPVVITSETTLEGIAKTMFGDAGKASDIAVYNGIASLEGIEPGTVIYVPILDQSKSFPDNLIYANKEDRDSFGVDVQLDGGEIVVSGNGDIEQGSGRENLNQAVLLRLQENVQNRIRVTMYGIRSTIADPVAGAAYLLASIEQTLLNEPRILEIEDIRYSGQGDNVYVEIDYIDIDNNAGTVVGGV